MTSFGPGGYPDGQRVANYDSPALWVDDPGLVTAQQRVSPILNVSRYAYLAGQFGETQSQSQVEITWYLDSAGAVAIGRRTFQLDFNCGLAQFRTANLGPYVRIVREATIFDATYGPESWVFASNRVYPLELVPYNPTLISQQDVPVTSGVPLHVYPAGYYCGPAMLWFLAVTQPGLITLEVVLPGGTWIPFMQQPVAGAGELVIVAVVPAGAWRATISNTGAGTANYYLVVTPSLTGAG